MGGNASDDVRRMIQREKEIMEGLKRIRKSARNKTVKAQCDAQISEATRNVAYLEQSLENLKLNKEVAPASKDSSKVTRLDLFRWDKPQNMGPRIQLMLQQLEYKLSIEQQYERGTRKMIQLYTQTGDRKVQQETHANLDESRAKITLLTRSKKRYSDMNLAAVLGNDEEESDLNLSQPNVRRPLTGVLRVFVKQVEEVDHTIAWSDQVEMWVAMRVENNSAAVARTRPSTSSVMNEDFSIPVDKGNEIEFTVYDRAATANATPTPVALLWLRISDITEAIRQKRVEREFKETGWASAAKVQALNASGSVDDPKEVSNAKPGPGNAKTDPVLGANASGAAGAGANAGAGAGGANANANSPELETVEGWFTLEPAGRIYLKLGFEKTGSHLRKRPRMYDGTSDLAKLGRHNAIRKREETQQVHGHEFISQQAYNIVKCAVCGDFTTSYFQCQECQLTCDRKCFGKIVTKCVALMSQDPDEEINHSIPHHFEPTKNMKATWCAQCGFILPLASKKNVRKCTECSIMVHTSCANYVPDLCGMSMTMAAQVVNEINSTRIRQATKAAAVNLRQNKMGHQHTSSMSSLKTVQSRVPPPKNTPIRRKQVPSQVPPQAPSAEPLEHHAPRPAPPIPQSAAPTSNDSLTETGRPQESYAPINPVYVSPEPSRSSGTPLRQSIMSDDSGDISLGTESEGRSPEPQDAAMESDFQSGSDARLDAGYHAATTTTEEKRLSMSSKYPELNAFNTGEPIPVSPSLPSTSFPYAGAVPRKAPPVPGPAPVPAKQGLEPVMGSESDKIASKDDSIAEHSAEEPMDSVKDTVQPLNVGQSVLPEDSIKEVSKPAAQPQLQTQPLGSAVPKESVKIPQEPQPAAAQPVPQNIAPEPEPEPEPVPVPVPVPVSMPVPSAGETAKASQTQAATTAPLSMPEPGVEKVPATSNAIPLDSPVPAVPKDTANEQPNASTIHPLQPQQQPTYQESSPRSSSMVANPSALFADPTYTSGGKPITEPLHPANRHDAAPPASIIPDPYQQHLQQQQSQQPHGHPAGISKPAVPTSRAHKRRRKIGLEDFSFLAVLGKGNFGKVMLAESKRSNKLYAVKVLKKNFIIENREVESTRSEKRVFLIANRERHPFLVNLFACFQTENRIYFVMDYVSGGDLMFHIQQKMFTAKRAQFYAAEVLLALKHFHDNDVIYRDLKLDNILLSLDGHIKVADYGLCKENMGYGSTTGTFCGTPDFIAPEILLDQKYGRSVDWWALGVLMYQMLLGKSPFHGNDEDEVYDAILSDEPLYPIHMPRDSVSILQQLLTRDPSKRLGSGPTDALEIMSHPYFDNVNFDDLLNLRVEPPYKPELDSPTDVRYFEREFTSEMPALTPMNSVVTSDMQEEFRGFSYSLEGAI